MRNLRKYFAVFVAVAMLVTAMAPAFAADTATTTAPASTPAMTDAKKVETLGMLKGDGSGVTEDYLKSSVTRFQAAIMFLRLKGLESKALAFDGKDNFADADKVDWAEGKAALAYLKANKDLGWQGDGTNFDPNSIITAQGYYKILLVSLGYVEGKDFKYEDTLKFAESKGLKAAAKADPFTANDVAAATVEALKATTADGKATLLQTLIDAKVIDTAKAQTAGLVSSVTSQFTLTPGAKGLTVKFDAAPADTAKVTLTVTRDAGVAVSDLTTTWSADKTTATLAKSTNLVAGEYKVAVKNDTTDLGSKTAKVENEKLAKLELVSKVINRRSDTEGIAYYKALNQYGEDVTKNSVASNIQWNSSLGSGSVSADKGILTFTKGVTTDTAYMAKLKDYTTVPVVVTAYETDSSISFNDSLTVSTTVGDIQSIKLLGISNKDNKTTVEKGTSDIFYLDYEIKDSVGNLVTDYSILSNSSSFTLSPKEYNESSILYAKVVQDPNDSKKAKFQLKGDGIVNQIAGTQVISAIALTSGKSATFNIEVKEGSELKEFIIQKPTTDVAQGDGKVEIPYIALDSNGVAITDFTKISGKVTFGGINSDKIDQIQKSDGTYGLFMDFGSTKQTFTITATRTTTTSSKMSQMSVTVKDYAYPYDITTINATDCPQGVVFGAEVKPAGDKFTILDQYGRAVNLKHAYNFTDNGLYTLANGSAAVSPAVYASTYAVNSNATAITNFTTVTGATYAPVVFYNGFYYNNTSSAVEQALYYIAMWSNDEGTIKTLPASANGYLVSTDPGVQGSTRNYTIISGNKSGYYTPTADPNGNGSKSATINYSLRRIAPGAATSVAALVTTNTNTQDAIVDKAWVEVDSFSQTIYNVDKKDLTEFKFDSVTTPLYAATLTNLGSIFARQDNDVTGNRILGDPGFNSQFNTKQEREWNVEYKLRGYYNGIRTLMPTGDAVSFSVSDPDKFALNTATNAQSVYVLAKAWNTTDQNATFKSKLSAQVKGYNSVFYTASTDITSSVATPAISEVTVERNDYSTVQNIGTDYYTVTAADFNNRVNNKYITAFVWNTGAATHLQTGAVNTVVDGNYTPNATDRSDIYFMCKDQYGKKGTLPASIQVVKIVGNGTPALMLNPVTTAGKLSIPAATPTAAASEKYKITVTAPNGTYKTVVIEVTP